MYVSMLNFIPLNLGSYEENVGARRGIAEGQDFDQRGQKHFRRKLGRSVQGGNEAT